MTRHLLIAGAAIAALSVAACNRSSEDPGSGAPVNPPAAAPAPAPAAAPVAPAAMAAPDFVAQAAASDMFEVEAAKVAQTKAADAKVKAFAAMMVKDHTKSTEDLKAAIAQSGQAIMPPTALPADLQAKLDDLKAKPATEFDKAYMDGQVEAHQNALTLLQSYAEGGDVAQIKTFATVTAPVVQKHLDEARVLRDGLK